MGQWPWIRRLNAGDGSQYPLSCVISFAKFAWKVVLLEVESYLLFNLFWRFVETVQVQVKIYCYILQNSMNIEWYNGIQFFILPAIDFSCRKILTKKISNIAKPDVCISVVFVAKCKAHSLWATETPFFAWKNYGLSFALRPFFLLKAASYREPELELESSFR